MKIDTPSPIIWAWAIAVVVFGVVDKLTWLDWIMGGLSWYLVLMWVYERFFKDRNEATGNR